MRAAKDTAAATAVKGRRLEERVQNLEASLASARPGPGPESLNPTLPYPYQAHKARQHAVRSNDGMVVARVCSHSSPGDVPRNTSGRYTVT